ncbi:hypothetical protein BGZ76_004968 [Entomortierella beljakovae]|nr:hypothetical protein BGZ76_004968 [Entomortierella beljakovae]
MPDNNNGITFFKSKEYPEETRDGPGDKGKSTGVYKFSFGKNGNQNGKDSPDSNPPKRKSGPIDFGAHAHYLQHIIFFRFFYIPHLICEHEDEHNDTSDAFLLVTTFANTLFSILKIFVETSDQNHTAFIYRLLRFIFSLLGLLWNSLLVAIDLMKSPKGGASDVENPKEKQK